MDAGARHGRGPGTQRATLPQAQRAGGAPACGNSGSGRATYSNRRVIFDPAAERESTVWQLHRSRTLDFVLNVLRRDGYGVLEQRFPQRAYVLMRGADPIEQTAVPPRARAGSTRFQPMTEDE